MQPKHNKQLVSLAKQPQKEMAKEEQRLWYDFPRSYPVRFSRQKVLGKYISLISIAQKQNPSLSRAFLNTMRIEASKKMQAAPLFWRGMA